MAGSICKFGGSHLETFTLPEARNRWFLLR